MKKKFLIRTMALALALSMSSFVACGKKDNNGDGTTNVSDEQVEVANVAGTYVYSYTEEFDGEVVDLFNLIVLNEDNTCEVTFQDTIAGTWDASKITLDDGSEYEYKIEDGNLNLNMDGEWITFYKEESSINPPVIAAEDAYASIISELQPGQAYAFADICPSFDVLLVSEDGAYDYGDGIMGAINAKVYGLDADGNVIEYGEANSGGTAYPLAVYDGCLMICNNYRTMMEYIDDEVFSMITKKCVEVSYDTDGNATYFYMDADTQTDGETEDDSMMMEMYDMFNEATVINFTVVGGDAGSDVSNGEVNDFVSEKYTMSYKTDYFEAFEGENDGDVTFSYNHEGDAVAGSNVVIVTVIEDTDAMQVVKDYMELYEATEDEMMENYLGGDDVKGYCYSTLDLEAEGSELKTRDAYYTIPCGDDVILINTFRTISDDMDLENSIDAEIGELLISFQLN